MGCEVKTTLQPEVLKMFVLLSSTTTGQPGRGRNRINDETLPAESPR
jgi:hypothetical protein